MQKDKPWLQFIWIFDWGNICSYEKIIMACSIAFYKAAGYVSYSNFYISLLTNFIFLIFFFRERSDSSLGFLYSLDDMIVFLHFSITNYMYIFRLQASPSLWEISGCFPSAILFRYVGILDE